MNLLLQMILFGESIIPFTGYGKYGLNTNAIVKVSLKSIKRKINELQG